MHQRKLFLVLTFVIAACGRSEMVASSEPQTAITTANAVISTTASTPSTATSLPQSATVLRYPGGSDPVPLLTVNVPDGWENLGWAVLKGASPPDFMAFGVWSVANVYTDRCQWRGALLDPPLGPTADDLAGALAEYWGSDATAPVDAMVDGFAGMHMVLTVPTDVDFADCDSGRFKSWLASDGGERYYQGPGQIDPLWIFDVDGARLVINASYFPGASLEDRGELQQIIDSIQIASN